MNMMKGPDDNQAEGFALMVHSGLPAEDAIQYFIVEEDPREIAAWTARWMRARNVRAAMLKLMGKTWQEMSLGERIDVALNQHYNQLAYILYNSHYVNASSTDKTKLDTARTTLEAKKAGTAGQSDPLTRFFEDVQSGKVKLSQAATVRIGQA